MNLSQQTFTFHEFKLLNRNLNYIPNPGNYNTHNLELDTNKFIRNIILRSHFGNDDNHKADQYRHLKENNSQWLP